MDCREGGTGCRCTGLWLWGSVAQAPPRSIFPGRTPYKPAVTSHTSSPHVVSAASVKTVQSYWHADPINGSCKLQPSRLTFWIQSEWMPRAAAVAQLWLRSSHFPFKVKTDRLWTHLIIISVYHVPQLPPASVTTHICHACCGDLRQSSKDRRLSWPGNYLLGLMPVSASISAWLTVRGKPCRTQPRLTQSSWLSRLNISFNTISSGTAHTHTHTHSQRRLTFKM